MQLFSTFPVRSAVLGAMVVLGACSKKSDDTPAPASTTYATTWTADSKNYTATTNNGAVNNNMLSISAVQTVSNSESYTVTMGNLPAATGTYTLGSGSNAVAGYSTTASGTTTSYIAGGGIGSGTIVVTTYSATEIIGTFTFTGMATNSSATMKAVTNGKFAIKR